MMSKALGYSGNGLRNKVQDLTFVILLNAAVQQIVARMKKQNKKQQQPTNQKILEFT